MIAAVTVVVILCWRYCGRSVSSHALSAILLGLAGFWLHRLSVVFYLGWTSMTPPLRWRFPSANFIRALFRFTRPNLTYLFSVLYVLSLPPILSLYPVDSVCSSHRLRISPPGWWSLPSALCSLQKVGWVPWTRTSSSRLLCSRQPLAWGPQHSIALEQKHVSPCSIVPVVLQSDQRLVDEAVGASPPASSIIIVQPPTQTSPSPYVGVFIYVHILYYER